MAGRGSRLLSRLSYGFVYLLLYIVLLGLLLITPADAIERSLSNEQTYNVWILAVCYITTIVIVGSVYFLRLYLNKSVLASIPKTWVPIDRSDLPKRVYKLIDAGLNRSAAIAYHSRPRVSQSHGTVPIERQDSRTSQDGREVGIKGSEAVWGEIEHRGWATPLSADLPNLQYSTVISELPNLIEAKALTLASPQSTSPSTPPVLDPDAAVLLQRPAHMSLHDYIVHLGSLGMVPHGDQLTIDFLRRWSHARYSTQPLSMAQFRELMHLFAEILRLMRPLDLDALDGQESYTEADSNSVRSARMETDIDDARSLRTDPSTPTHTLSRPVTASTQDSVRRPAGGRASPTTLWAQYHAAPQTPSMGGSSDVTAWQARQSSFAQSRRPYPASQPSTASLRSKTSTRSGTGSVIRLATDQDGSGFPYVLSMSDSALSS